MMMLSHRTLAGYSLLAMPLAMAVLPIYVYVPKFYASSVGVPLAWIGLILFATRMLDALQDPLLGYLSDRAAPGRWGRSMMIWAGVPLLAIGFVALFHPPVDGSIAVLAWLAASLVLVYLGFSAASISYLAMGAELTTDYHERTRVTVVRGFVGLLGVLLASVMPELLSRSAGAQHGIVAFSVVFVPVLLACAVVTLLSTPRRTLQDHPTALSWKTMFSPLGNREFRWLIAVTVASGIAGAIPATLILFFVDDVLQSTRLAGFFLAAYFLGGALTMPVWVTVSRLIGKKNAWTVAMLLAVASFVWAFALGEGDVFAFFLVCVLSGAAYGAELALPASILADLVEPGDGRRASHGAYFGLWQMIEKLCLAGAAGIALPLLAALDYTPGANTESTFALSAVYALLPCAAKLVAVIVLRASPLDHLWSERGAAISKGEVRC